jgi:hypothetical protein
VLRHAAVGDMHADLWQINRVPVLRAPLVSCARLACVQASSARLFLWVRRVPWLCAEALRCVLGGEGALSGCYLLRHRRRAHAVDEALPSAP